MKASQTILIGLACALAWPIAELRQNNVVVAQSRDNRTTTGEFIVDPPTLINLGFEWFIQGDDNRNASVAVAYRRQGSAQWASGLPLLRLQGERISANDRMDVISPNMFAGSILDLEPNTAYEVRMTLTDPDGVSGETTKNVTVRTRREPMPHPAGRVFHVYPPGSAPGTSETEFTESGYPSLRMGPHFDDWCQRRRPVNRAVPQHL
jgi:hypothetical protein